MHENCTDAEKPFYKPTSSTSRLGEAKRNPTSPSARVIPSKPQAISCKTNHDLRTGLSYLVVIRANLTASEAGFVTGEAGFGASEAGFVTGETGFAAGEASFAAGEAGFAAGEADLIFSYAPLHLDGQSRVCPSKCNS